MCGERERERVARLAASVRGLVDFVKGIDPYEPLLLNHMHITRDRSYGLRASLSSPVNCEPKRITCIYPSKHHTELELEIERER